MTFLKKLYIYLFSLVLGSSVCFGQATLPVYRDAWGTTPTGWTDGQGGTPTYGSSCGGSDATSGRLDNSNESFVVNFNGTPTVLTYNLQGNGFSGGTFIVQESTNGTVWTTIRTFTTMGGCTPYSDNLLSTTRYVRFLYSVKSTGNVQLDNVTITSGISGPQSATGATISNQCINSLTLGWTSPASYSISNNTILVFAKANAAITVGSATSSVATYSADSDFSGLGTAYQNDPLAKCIYKGDGTSVDITGLSSTTPYHFLILNVVDASSIYSSPLSTSAATSSITPVSNQDATAGSGQVAVTWINPSTCYDEVLVLGRAGTNVDAPTGYGIGTTASANFGAGSTIGSSFVVYKGTGTTVTVNSLTNGTNYCFKTFVRKGNIWSSGVEVCATPSTSSGTILNPGDLAIVGYDAQYLGSGNPDLISFVNLVPLNPGTKFLLTDNGFEVVSAPNVRDNAWGNAEGTISLTWNGPGVLPKGTVTTYYTDAVPAGWSVGCVSDRDGISNGCTVSDFNFAAAGDQLFILQGTWNEGTYTCGATYGSTVGACSNASFSGRMISGFNGITPGWIPTNQTPFTLTSQLARNSRLPRELRCFNTESTSNITRLQYNNSSPRTGTQRNLLGNIKNIANWTTFTSGSFSLSSFTVGLGWIAGKWVGDVNPNWFDCANWDNLFVPDENTDVLVSNSAVNVASVSSFALYSDEFLDVAKSRDIIISGSEVVVDANPLNVLKVYGNLTISSTGVLDMSDGSNGTPDGSLYLYGNWSNLLNETEFKQGESTIHLVGTENQSIANITSENETFYNLRINKPTGDVNLSGNNDITIDPLGTLTFTNGIVNSSKSVTSFVIFQSTATSTGASVASFVNGPVQKISSATTPFTFPIGDVITSSGTYLFRPLGISPASSSNTTYESEYTGVGYGNYTLGTGVTDVTTKEWWRLDRNSGTANSTVQLTWGVESDIPNELTSTLSGLLVAHFNGTAWDSQGGVNHIGNTIDGSVTSSATGNVFGEFTLATNISPLSSSLFYLMGHRTSEGNKLSWTINKGAKISHFEIQKSKTEYNFEAIGMVRFTTNKNSYDFLDEALFPSFDYYRIKTIGIDGSSTYSNLIKISQEYVVPAFYSFPNPFENQITLIYSGNPEEILSIQLISSLGVIVGSKQGNNHELNLWLNTQTKTLSSAIYFLSLQSSNEQYPLLKILKK